MSKRNSSANILAEAWANPKQKKRIIVGGIVLVIFLFFKDDISMYLAYIGPKDIPEDHTEIKQCVRQVTNPKYYDAVNKVNSDVYSQCDKKYPKRDEYFVPWGEEEKNKNKIANEQHEQFDACKENGIKNAKLPPEKIGETYDCQKTVTEVWKYIFGIKMFKVK